MALSLLKGGKSNYAYAVARVRARRAKLIPRAEFEKIVKMDVAEITRFIEETTYKTEVDELANRFSGLDLLEAALMVNQERTFHAVRHMIGGEGGGLLATYLNRFQFEDLKTVLRGKRAGAAREELLRELLIEDKDTLNLFQPLLADDVQTTEQIADTLARVGGLGQEFANILRGVSSEASPAQLEDALDRAYFDRALTALTYSQEKGAREMRAFLRQEVDAINLLNAARWVAAGQSADFSPFVIPRGNHFDVSFIVQLARCEELGAFADGLKDHPVYEQIGAALDEAAKTGRLSAVQGAVRHWHMAALDRLSSGHPLSLIPVLVYVLRKHEEVVQLRAIARGKASGLPEQRLKELIL